MKKILCLIFASFASASMVLAGFMTAADGFEADTAGNPPASSRGWATTSVTVSNANAHSGSKAAYFSDDAVATNTISATSPTKAWSDFHIVPALGAEPISAPTNEASVIFFFDADGYVNVWNSTDWLVCSNDVWGTSVTALNGNDYAWISIYQNFANKEYAVFVNDVLVAQDIPFAKDTLADYSSFVVQNVDSNAWLDDVWVNASYTTGHSQNKNGRAGVDVVEVDTYGYAGRTLYVNGTGNGTPNYSTIAAAVAIARDHDIINIGSGYATTDENITITPSSELTAMVFEGNCFTVNTFTVNSGVTITLNSCLKAGTITANDDITLASGADLTATTKLDLKNGATVTGTSGSDITIADLDMVTGTTIDVTGGTISESQAGLNLEGTFTVNGNDWDTWDNGTIMAQSLPFTEDFEKYTADSKISAAGLYGWGSDSDDVKVQNSVAHSGKALILPDGTSASNKIDSATGSIWTYYYLRPVQGVAPTSVDSTGKSFLSYVDTNGYMVVYTSNAWMTCSNTLCAADATNANDIFTGHAPTALATNSFRRVAIYQNFTKQEFALFIDNASGKLELVTQKQSFPDTQTSLNHFVINNIDNNAYIDSITISTTAPTGSTDLDGDGKPDVEEIQLSDSVYIYPSGNPTIFKFI